MSDPKIIDQDLRDYLEKEPNLSKGDKLKYLQTIFYKHQEITNLDHVVNYRDLFQIFQNARMYMVKTRFPVRITKKELETSEVAHIAIMEAFTMYLNSMNILKKLVKFDYKD